MLKMIVAVADNWAIGYKGDLLARISTDLKRFKEFTTGNAVIMGYNTLLSLPGGKPLKNRENIVLYPGEIEIDGARIVQSLNEAVQVCSEIKDKDVFVIGGGSVYNQLLPYCDTAYITKIDKHYEADTFIYDLDKHSDWYVYEESEQYFDTDGTPYRYVTYKRKKIIAYIGAGMMASALTTPAYDNGVTVRLVGTPLDDAIIDRLRIDNYHTNLKRYITKAEYYNYSEFDEALDGVYDVVCGVSSFGVDWFADEVLPKLKPKCRVLSVTKGLLDNGDGTVTDYPSYFKSKAENIHFAAVGGACTSYELADRNVCTVTFCSAEKWVSEHFKSLLNTDYYNINVSADVRGVETAVALKNAYALAVSSAIGLAHKRDGENCAEHYNTEAALFEESLKEMKQLITLFGGGEEALFVGAGDLYVTIFGGRTRKLGILLGEGFTAKEALEKLSGITLESVVIIKRMCSALNKLAENNAEIKDKYPLILHMGAVLSGDSKIDIPWDKFTGK